MSIAFASVPPMIAIQPKTRKILGFNQQSYQALKSSMALNLRRQLLIAVCDNVDMQNQLATQLERDLAKGGPTSLDAMQLGGVVKSMPIAQDFSGQLPRATSPVVGLNRLMFDPEDGNLPKQVANWVRQTMLEEGELPMVQVLGIEQMTRQPAITQNHFLRSLEKIESLLPRLNTSLLVWLPWPWLRTIQQSATTFWNWRTGLFEFVSEPTSAALNLESSHLHLSAVEDAVESHIYLEAPPNHQDDLTGIEDLTAGRDRTLGSLDQGDVQHQATNDLPSVIDVVGEQTSSEQVSGLYGEGATGEKRLEEDIPSEFDAVTPSAASAVDVDNEFAASEFAASELEPSEASHTARSHTILSEQVNDDANYEIVYDAADLDPQVEAAEIQPSEIQSSEIQPSEIQPSEIQPSEIQPSEIQGPDVDLAPQQLSLSDAPTLDPVDEISIPEQANPEQANPEQANPEQAEDLTAKNPRSVQRRVKKRRRIHPSVMGGLRTVVSKGVNAANEQPRANDGQAMRSAQTTTGSLQDDDGYVDSAQVHEQTLHQPAAMQGTTEALTDSLGVDQNRADDQKEVQRRLDRQKAADDYFTVGMVYRTRIENGERGLDLIEPAIAAYEGGLRCLTGPHPDWGSGLNDLGTLYWLKAQQINDQQQAVDCMVHSIQLYQEALDKLSEPTQPVDSQADDIVGQLYSNMGAVYTMLATYDEPVSYLTQAAVTYQKALPLYSVETDPMDYATLQNSLGSVYWKLAHYDAPTDYLHRAIAAYNSALTGYVPEYQPLDYAAVQNNLGITYWSLAKHEPPMLLLKHAISAYRDALNYRTPEVDPGACAITYNNLALAYWDLSKEGAQGAAIDVAQRTRYQKNAVTAFEAALNTSKIANSLGPADRAAIFHCLGDVHIQMADTAPSLSDVATCLQKSLYSYLRAIEGVPADSSMYQGRLSAIVANLRAHYDQLGLAGQQAALNRVPPDMLSLVMLSL